MKKKLGDLLIDAGFITEVQLNAGLGEQEQWGGKLGMVLVGKGFISAGDLLRVLAHQMGVDFVYIWQSRIDLNAVKSIKPALAKKHNIFPYAVTDDTITIAMTDPRNLQLIDDIKFAVNKKLKPVLAELEEIKLAIRKYYDHEVVEDWEFEKLIKGMEKRTHAAMSDPTDMRVNIEIDENGGVEVNDVELEEPDASQMPASSMDMLTESETPSESEPKPQPKSQPQPKRNAIVIEKTLVSLINVLIRNGLISKEELVAEMKDK